MIGIFLGKPGGKTACLCNVDDHIMGKYFNAPIIHADPEINVMSFRRYLGFLKYRAWAVSFFLWDSPPYCMPIDHLNDTRGEPYRCLATTDKNSSFLCSGCLIGVLSPNSLRRPRSKIALLRNVANPELNSSTVVRILNLC